MVAKICLVSAWVMLWSAALGQPKKISPEDAWRIYNSMTDISQKCDTAIFMASSLFMYNQAEQARALLTDAIQMAEESKLNSELISLYFELSRCDERDKAYDEAINNAHKALLLIKADSIALKGKLLTHLSRYYLKMNA